MDFWPQSCGDSVDSFPAPPLWCQGLNGRSMLNGLSQWVHWLKQLLRNPKVETTENLWSTAGYRLRIQVVHSHSASAFLVIVPDSGHGIHQSKEDPTVVELMEVLPCSFVFYDPAGVGGSWGNTEKDDVEHEDNLQVVVESLPKDAVVGVLAIERGLSVAMRCEPHLTLSLLADINGQYKPKETLSCRTPRISLCRKPKTPHQAKGVIVGNISSFTNLIKTQLCETN